jgi:VanZ family protein
MSSQEQTRFIAPPLKSNHSVSLNWIPPVLWIAMIAFGGSDSFSSGHTFIWLNHLLGVFRLNVVTLETLNAVLRKVGHFSVYAVLSFLLFRAWRATLQSHSPTGTAKPAWSGRACALAIAGSALVAALDEFHQSFSPDRTPAGRDVALDTFGAVFVQLLLMVLLIHRRRRLAG